MGMSSGSYTNPAHAHTSALNSERVANFFTLDTEREDGYLLPRKDYICHPVPEKDKTEMNTGMEHTDLAGRK